MKLLVNGCSFLNHRHSNGIDVNFSTAEVIKDKCKFENMTNLARGGRGNDRIFLSTMAYFEGDSKQKKNTFVLIGWSASTRLDYPTREDFKPTPPLDQCWSTIKMFEHEKGFDKMARIKIDHVHWSITRYFQNVIGLQNYLKTNKIPFLFYNSLSPFLFNGKRDHVNWQMAIDDKHFYKLESSHHEYCKEHKLFISEFDEHPSADGHKKWAEKIYKYIQQQGLQNEI